MECVCRYSWLDFLFSLVGVCTCVFDLCSDVCLAGEFYRLGRWWWFAALLGFMLGSSLTVQMFSWFWIRYDSDVEELRSAHRSVLLCVAQNRLTLTGLLHVCQLGFLLRHLSVIWLGFCVWWRGERGSEFAVYLTHDLSMLRLIETFCESAPQLSLMIYILIHNNQARTIQYISVVASTTSIAWMVVDYHRSLRSFLPEKSKQGWSSSLVYFLWNLLLIAPRVVTVALFTSVLPCYILPHFLCLWPAFILWAWKQGTGFMESPAGEWLYRATVGLIWYFSWFNVAEGKTRGRSVIYHSFMMCDGGILLLTWWWLRDEEKSSSYALLLLVLIPLSYVTGLLVKTLYYCCFHPTLWPPAEFRSSPALDAPDSSVVLSSALQTDSSFPEVVNKRMIKHVNNFYSMKTPPVTKTKTPETNRVV